MRSSTTGSVAARRLGEAYPNAGLDAPPPGCALAVLPPRPAQRQAQGRQRNQAGEHLAEIRAVRHQSCRDVVHGGNAAN